MIQYTAILTMADQ